MYKNFNNVPPKYGGNNYNAHNKNEYYNKPPSAANKFEKPNEFTRITKEQRAYALSMIARYGE